MLNIQLWDYMLFVHFHFSYYSRAIFWIISAHRFTTHLEIDNNFKNNIRSLWASIDIIRSSFHWTLMLYLKPTQNQHNWINDRQCSMHSLRNLKSHTIPGNRKSVRHTIKFKCVSFFQLLIGSQAYLVELIIVSLANNFKCTKNKHRTIENELLHPICKTFRESSECHRGENLETENTYPSICSALHWKWFQWFMTEWFYTDWCLLITYA